MTAASARTAATSASDTSLVLDIASAGGAATLSTAVADGSSACRSCSCGGCICDCSAAPCSIEDGGSAAIGAAAAQTLCKVGTSATGSATPAIARGSTFGSAIGPDDGRAAGVRKAFDETQADRIGGR